MAAVGAMPWANWPMRSWQPKQILPSNTFMSPRVLTYPMYNPEDTAFGKDKGRNNAFLLVKNVKVYGSFSETTPEVDTSLRNITTNKTILSGDIRSVDNDEDNCYHVVIASGDAENALLDGVTITRGYVSNGDIWVSTIIIINGLTVLNSYGGGIYLISSSPKISNCVFSANNVARGGGMYIEKAAPTVLSCLFSADPQRS